MVVIAIIAILASLLMPALKNARESTKTLQCRNNLKQIGAAYALYTQEYGDQLPAIQPNYKATKDSGSPDWTMTFNISAFKRYLGYNNSHNSPWFCPKDPDLVSNCSYGFNPNAIAWYDPTPQCNIAKPASTILLGDKISHVAPLFISTTTIGDANLSVDFRHQGMACFLFFDGHSESLPPSKSLTCDWYK